MLSSIQSLLQLKKEVPDAVGYDTYGPISFPIPQEFQNSLKESHDDLDFINLTSLRIDNYSSKTQKGIRILYSGDYLYTPTFGFQRRDISVSFELKNEEKEITINEIPPNESVWIQIFYPSDDFEVVQVLLGDSEITSLMQKLTEARRYPELARMKLFMYATVIIAAIALCFGGYAVWKSMQEKALLNAAYSDFASCTPAIMQNPIENEEILERKFQRLGVYWKNYILSSNKVDSFDQLKLKDQLVWCEPNKP